MKHKKNILLIILIISSLGLILLPKSVIGSIADIHYTFNNDVIYDSDILYNNSFNLANPTSFTEIYKGTYSFQNDTDYSNPNDFTDIYEVGGSVNVIPSIDGHDKVLELNDTVNGDIIQARQYFSSAQDFGTIEYWIRTNNAGFRNPIIIYNDLAAFMGINIDDDVFKYTNNVGAWASTGKTALDNTWYHIRIDFRCTGAPAYKGLTANYFMLYINGIEFGEYIAYIVHTDVNNIRFYSNGADFNYISYYDGIGYSWDDDYSINDNITPIIEVDLTTQEVDRFEYALDGVNSLNARFSSNPSGWSETEGGDGQVFVDTVFDPLYDREIAFITAGASVLTFYRDNLGSIAEIINITTSLYIEVIGVNHEWFFMIDSSDGSQITALYADLQAGSLYYDYDGLNLLRNDLVIDTKYEFNLCINYEIDMAILLYYVDGVFIERYSFPLDIVGKVGLKRVEFALISDTTCGFYIDYCGIYADGISISDEYGYNTVNTEIPDWDWRNNNLYEFQISGYTHIGAVADNYVPEESMATIKSWKTYVNNSIFYNLYDSFDFIINLATIVFTYQGNNITSERMKIDGVKLTEGLNEYYLEYSHGGIEIETSYFYVDINNRLQFNLISNDTDTEYIQATFDISDVSSTDKAISFRGSIIAKAFGYFIVDYLAGLTTVDIPIFEKTTRAILPANKTIDNLIILITDNDIDAITGITSGYVSEPIILNVLGIGLPILTTGLIEMMIPLLLIMIPTLLISQGFGKEGKKLLIPLFLVFSLIATATLIIPVWIFFIVLFGSGLFLARNKEIEVK